MNGYMVLTETVALLSEELHPAWSLGVGGHHPSLPRTASIHLLLSIQPEGHYILEKVMASLEKGILTGVTGRLNLFETHR